MNHFDRMVREYVTPVLREAGFASRGRTFRLGAGSGDEAIVSLRRAGGRGDRVEFHVDLGVVVVPYWDWLGHVFSRPADRVPTDTDGLWRSRLDAPPAVRADAGPWTRNLWLLAGPDQVPACGAALAEVLRAEAVPLLTRLLDRGEFLALSRDPDRPLGTDLGPAELMLLVDAGPSAELVAEIARYESLDPETYPYAGRLAAWARDRAAARGHNGVRSG
jgi:hypothetical protein